MSSITTEQLQPFILHTLGVASTLTLSTYARTRILLYQIPFDVAENTTIISKVALICPALVTSIYVCFHLPELTFAYGKTLLTTFKAIRFQLPRLITIGIAISLFAACNIQSTGTKKDLSTGMLTSYNGISAEETQMVMNDEIMNHDDVSIGASFVIINKGIKGLTLQDDKVSVSCLFTISDKNGKILLSEPDLLKGSDTYNKNQLDFSSLHSKHRRTHEVGRKI